MINKKLITYLIYGAIIAICFFCFLLRNKIKRENKISQTEEKAVTNIPTSSITKIESETSEPSETEPRLLTPKHIVPKTNIVRNIPDTQDAIIPLDDPVPDDDFSVYVEEALRIFRLNTSEEEKEKALEDMISINHPMTVPVILLALDDENEYIRSLAIEALKFINHPDVIPAVEKALDDENSEIRQDALGALMHIKDENIATALTKALNDNEATVRETVFEIMLMQDSPRFIPVAEAALKSSEPDNQLNAISALEDIPAPEAIDAIINYGLLSNFDSTRDEAIESLQNISGQNFSTYEDWNKWWNSIKDECPKNADADSWEKWWHEKKNGVME